MLKKLLEYTIGNLDEVFEQLSATNTDSKSDQNTKINTAIELNLPDKKQEEISTDDEKSSSPCPDKKCGQCTDRMIPFAGTIKTCIDILDIKCLPTLIGYKLNVNCKKVECKKNVDVHVCDQILKCTIPLDVLNFDGNATLLLSVDALLDLNCPGSKEVSLVTCADIKINQTCFACQCSGHCPCEKCKLLKLESIHAKKTGTKEIIITGFMKFICP